MRYRALTSLQYGKQVVSGGRNRSSKEEMCLGEQCCERHACAKGPKQKKIRNLHTLTTAKAGSRQSRSKLRHIHIQVQAHQTKRHHFGHTYPSASVMTSVMSSRHWARVPYTRHFSTTLLANLCWLMSNTWPIMPSITKFLSSGRPCSSIC